jgi:ABC-type protease/lipase transport system fused ATPase/permease subunit
VVPQEPILFSGSIADNIRYGRLDASLDEIIEAAKSANAHDFVLRLPNGYDTEVGERGVQLSGGERQRICVARAFLKNAPILILDEPTSSIDSKTEAVILDALDRLMVGRTTFMIAHRLSTIRHSDLIVVLNQGCLVEQGRHDELVQLNGLYKQLHDVQTSQARRKTRLTSAAYADSDLDGPSGDDGTDEPGGVSDAEPAAVLSPLDAASLSFADDGRNGDHPFHGEVDDALEPATEVR